MGSRSSSGRALEGSAGESAPGSERAIGQALARARAVVLDFDGTLVDSNPIKLLGFQAAFADFPDRLPEILAYCRGAEHTPRGEKFRHVYEAILGMPFTTATRERLEARFASATTERIVHAPEIPGAAEFLRRVAGRRATAVLSTTPHSVLVEIIERRSWCGFFDIVRGAPVNKAKWLRKFRARHHLAWSELIFFGDSAEDAAAARRAECAFVGVGPAAFAGVAAIKDFTELEPE